MTNFVKVQLTVPVEVAEEANRCAAVFDFDQGGAATFGRCKQSATGELPVTHYKCNTAIRHHYLSLLTDPENAYAALLQLSVKYDRVPPSESDVQTFCSNLQVGDTGLITIEEEEE